MWWVSDGNFNPESSVINGNDLVTTHKYSNYAELMNEAKSDNRQGGNSKVKSTAFTTQMNR